MPAHWRDVIIGRAVGVSRGLCRVDLTLAAIALDIGIARIAIRHLQSLGMLRARRQGGGFTVRSPNDSGAKSC